MGTRQWNCQSSSDRSSKSKTQVLQSEQRSSFLDFTVTNNGNRTPSLLQSHAKFPWTLSRKAGQSVLSPVSRPLQAMWLLLMVDSSPHVCHVMVECQTGWHLHSLHIIVMFKFLFFSPKVSWRTQHFVKATKRDNAVILESREFLSFFFSNIQK